METVIEWYLNNGESMESLVGDALLLFTDRAMVRTNGNLMKASKLAGVGNCSTTMVRYLRSTSKSWRKGREMGIHTSIESEFTSLVEMYLDQGISVHYLVRDIREKATDMAMRKRGGNLSMASRNLGISRASFSKYLGMSALEWRNTGRIYK